MNNSNNLLTALGLLFISLFMLSCKPHFSWKYYNQLPPGDSAVLFAPEIIKHMAHSSPSFTPNGDMIYWSTVSEEGDTRKIYFVEYENGKWSKPQIAPFSGMYHDDQPFISYDGSKLFFASKRPKSINDTIQNLDIWIADKTQDGWGEPHPVNDLIGFWTPTVARNGNLYFIDLINGQPVICGAEFSDGSYTEPEILPELINLPDTRNWCPFISANEDFLIFSSDRPGGYGSGDLYISFRDESESWSEPINLGPKVNTALQERFPGVSPDGRNLFFTRWFKPPHYHDLYWIDADFIEKMKPNR